MVCMSSPFKDPKTGVYKLRKRVPRDIQSVLGKSEYWSSLDTKDLGEAKRLFPLALVECNRVFDAARSEMSGSAFKLHRKDASALAGTWLNNKLEEEREPPSEAAVDAWAHAIIDDVEAKRWTQWEPLAEQIAAKHKLPVTKGTESFNVLCEELAKAEVKYWNIAERRFGGDWTDKGTEVFAELQGNPG